MTSAIANPQSEAPTAKQLRDTALTRAQDLVAKYAEACHKLKVKKAELEQELEAVRSKHRPEIDTLTKAVDAAQAEARVFSVANRELVFRKKQSLKLLHGTAKFQLGKAFLELLGLIKEHGDQAWHTALQILKSLEWGSAYVRTIEEIDKETLIKDWKAGKITTEQLAEAGLVIGQKERFSITLKEESVPAGA
jgi:hypothetical protein